MAISQGELELVRTAEEWLPNIKDITPGKRLEALLNTKYGPQSEFYQKVGSHRA